MARNFDIREFFFVAVSIRYFVKLVDWVVPYNFPFIHFPIVELLLDYDTDVMSSRRL